MCCQRKLVGLYAVGQVERRASLNKHADAVSRAEGARRVQSSVALGVSKVHLWALLMQGVVGREPVNPSHWAVRAMTWLRSAIFAPSAARRGSQEC